MMYLFSFLIFLPAAISAEADASLEQFINGNRLLTADLYKRIAVNNKDNFLLNVFPLEAALTYLQSGTKGVTGQQIRSVLRLPLNQDDANNVTATLLSFFTSDKNCTFGLAHKIYVCQNLTIVPNFKNNDTDAENIDFGKADTAQKMSTWVEKQTQGQVRNFVNANDLSSNLTAVVLNTFFFKSNWVHRFLTEESMPGNFYRNKTDVVQVNMMYQRGLSYSYKDCSFLNATFLELPLGSSFASNCSIVFVLPHAKNGIDDLERNLEYLFSPQETKKEVFHIQLPKFHFETKLDMEDILKELGVRAVFNKNVADLSGIAGAKGDMVVDKVFQKTVIDVNEWGIGEFSSASTIVFPTSNGTVREFIADHPFIFYVKIKDVIIFAGRIVTPNVVGT